MEKQLKLKKKRSRLICLEHLFPLQDLYLAHQQEDLSSVVPLLQLVDLYLETMRVLQVEVYLVLLGLPLILLHLHQAGYLGQVCLETIKQLKEVVCLDQEEQGHCSALLTLCFRNQQRSKKEKVKVMMKEMMMLEREAIVLLLIQLIIILERGL